MFSILLLYSLTVFSCFAVAEDIDQVLNDAKSALNDSSAPTPAPSRPKKKSFLPPSEKGTSSDSQLNITLPLAPTEARQILNVDLKSLAKEEEPQDPRFTVSFSGGFYMPSPSFALTKDDDSFQLTHQAQMSGGSLSLTTSWHLIPLFKERAALKFVFSGGAGLFTGQAEVARQGVENSISTHDYYFAPIHLGAGPGVEILKSINIDLTYGPSVELVSQKGNGQTDTLSAAFGTDELDLQIGTSLGKGWEAGFDFIDNGVLSTNVKAQGFLLGFGYRISG